MPDTSTDRSKALSSARNAAVNTLIENHKDEFNKAMIAEAKKRGEEWTPRKTEEEKAQEQFEALLAEHPHLAEKIRAEVGEPDSEFPND